MFSIFAYNYFGISHKAVFIIYILLIILWFYMISKNKDIISNKGFSRLERIALELLVADIILTYIYQLIGVMFFSSQITQITLYIEIVVECIVAMLLLCGIKPLKRAVKCTFFLLLTTFLILTLPVFILESIVEFIVSFPLIIIVVLMYRFLSGDISYTLPIDNSEHNDEITFSSVDFGNNNYSSMIDNGSTPGSYYVDDYNGERHIIHQNGSFYWDDEGNHYELISDRLSKM